MTRPLRIGFLGTGLWATQVARAICRSPEIEIVAACAPIEEERESFAGEFDCRPCATEEELLASPDIDAVAVMSPNRLHHEQCLNAASSGRHVYVEKPMAMNAADAISIQRAAQEAGVCLFVGHNTRRESRFRKIKNMLDQARIGRPIIANISFTSPAGLGQQLGSWRYDPKQTPAVALVQIGIHAIDLLNYLFSYPERVMADIRSSGAAGEIEDLCMATMHYADGVTASFNNGYAVARDRSLKVHGTKGVLITPDEKTIILRESDGREAHIAVELNDTVLEEFTEFANCCRSKRKPETGGDEGALAVAVMEAMLDSSRASQYRNIRDYISIRTDR